MSSLDTEKAALHSQRRSERHYTLYKGFLLTLAVACVLAFIYVQTKHAAEHVVTTNQTNFNKMHDDVKGMLRDQGKDTKTFVCNLMVQLELIRQDQFDSCFNGDLRHGASTPTNSNSPPPLSLNSSDSPNQQSSNTNSNIPNQNEQQNNPPPTDGGDPGVVETFTGCIMDKDLNKLLGCL